MKVRHWLVASVLIASVTLPSLTQAIKLTADDECDCLSYSPLPLLANTNLKGAKKSMQLTQTQASLQSRADAETQARIFGFIKKAFKKVTNVVKKVAGPVMNVMNPLTGGPMGALARTAMGAIGGGGGNPV